MSENFDAFAAYNARQKLGDDALLGEWRRSDGRGGFTVEEVSDGFAIGHYWFPTGRQTLRRGRMTTEHLKRRYAPVAALDAKEPAAEQDRGEAT